MKVADIISLKSGSVKMVRPNDTIGTLSRNLQQARVGAMVVSDDGETLDGIISERDVAYGLASRRGDLHLVKVSVLMTTNVHTCTPETSGLEAANLMAERHVRHLPVVENNKVVGVISMRDLLRPRLDELERRTKRLEQIVTIMS